MTDQYAEEKRWVFSFDLKEESEDECLTERGRELTHIHASACARARARTHARTHTHIHYRYMHYW